jgi:predicted ATPase
MFHQLGINEEDLKIKVNYIGPFRIPAPHCVVYQGQDNTLTVGYDGRGAYNILLNSYRLDKELYRKVSEWMGTNLEGQQLDFGNTANSSGVYNLQVAKDGYKTNMTGVGQGVAQVLPIITQSYIAEEGSINAIEQPALHLHPACHSCISYRLGQSAKERHCSYVIESHSENLLLGFRHLVVNPDVDFTPDDIVIYFVDRDEEEQVAFLEKITINDNGDLSSWPTGVFSEGFELLREINRMRR